MRAIQMTEFGGPEVLKLVELPMPVPAPDEVLIRVARAGMNFADAHTRTNSYVQKATLPLVPGREVAGRARGHRRARRRADQRRRLRRVRDGARRTSRSRSPTALDDGTALALMVQGLTAWHLYRTAGRVAEGESVVVHSAAGGVGSLAVQLGRSLGAGRVIATASSEDKRELALELGAHVARRSRAEGLTERLIEANGGHEVDVVFDMAGGAVFDASYRALAHFGRIVVCGIATQEPNQVSTGSLLRHSRAVVGFYLFHCLGRPGMFGPSR